MQRAILELRYGTTRGMKRVLSPGDSVRVGRKPRADWIVADERMSGLHFELAFDGARCEVRDLKSADGTLVSGQRIDAPAEIGNGGWIRAGETDFMVYLEAATPPDDDALDAQLAADPDDLEPNEALWVAENRERLLREQATRRARRAEALEALQKVEGPLFAVLDAARSDRVLTLLRESVETYRSLYEGIEGDALEHVAPHLVQLPPGSLLLERIVREGWGRRWGIFIEHPRGFDDLRKHLRRFLMVADADTRKKFYFRFYDPGVLRLFLPSSTPKQRAELFGDIAAFLVENERGRVTRFAEEGA